MKKSNEKNVVIFYLLAFLQGLVFTSSIATLYRTANGITLFEIGIIEVFFSLFIIMFELPFGYIGDRIGYKKTMLIANGVYFLSKVVFWRAESFGAFLFERLLLALSVSGLSGCDSSLLYLSVDSEKAASVFGKQSMFGVLGMVVSSICFTFAFHANMDYAAFATIIAFFLAFICTMFLDDIRDTDEKKVSLRNVWKSFIKNKQILFVLAASVLLTETTHTLTIFYNQLQYERIGIPQKYYGIIFMLLQLVGMSCGFLGNITKHISKEKLVYILFGTAAVSSGGLIFSEDIYSSMILLMILSCVESMYFPILTAIENESVEVSARASMMSLYSLIKNVMIMVTSFSFGKASDMSLQNAYYLAAAFCIIGFVLFYIWNRGKQAGGTPNPHIS